MKYAQITVSLMLFGLISVCQVTAQTAAKLPAPKASQQNAKKSVASNQNDEKQKAIDPAKLVVFTVDYDEQDQLRIRFEGKVKKEGVSDLGRIDTLVASEFESDKSLQGVLVRVSRKVTSSVADQIFAKVRKAMDDNQVKGGFYASILEDSRVTETSARPTNQDDKVTQEYVFDKKVADAEKVYEKSIRIAKAMKAELRLDKERNSLTVVGKERIVKSLLNFFKLQEKNSLPSIPQVAKGNNNLVPRNTNPRKNVDPRSANPSISKANTPRTDARVDERPLTPKTTRNSLGSSQSDPQGNASNPRLDPVANSKAKTSPNRPRSANMSQVPNSGNSSPGAGPVGRFQITAFGNDVLMIDTSSGEAWFLDGNEQTPFFWTPIPKPNRSGNN